MSGSRKIPRKASSMETPLRKQGEGLRRNYSESEVVDIYRLGKLWLETGQLKRAETVMSGLNEVAPEFSPAWLATSFLRSLNGNYDGALQAANQALKAEPSSAEAMLYIVTITLTLGDAATAGTYLGEVGEMVEQGRIATQHVARLYKMQLARYQARGK